MNWEPIETAPKDGTSILVWLDEEDTIAIAYCLGRHPTPIRPEPGIWIEPGAGRITPTHWMPLPKPPTAETE